MYDHALDIAGAIPALDNPESSARLRRALKPYFEETRTREIAIALAGLKTREGLAELQKNGIEVTDDNVVPFAEEEYSSAEYIWKNEQEQINKVTESLRSLIEIRKEIAVYQGKELTAEDWEDMRHRAVHEFASLSVYRVKKEPGADSVSALRYRIPLIRSFTSKVITELIDTVWDQEVRQG